MATRTIQIELIDNESLESIMLNVLKKFEAEKQKSELDTKLYSINQVAILTHQAHGTISKLVGAGIIKVTANGKISQLELNKYLKTL